jgi:hypothetical protein
VSDLIDPTTKTWKEDIVREIFYKPDADEVLQINIPSLNGDDFIAWNYEKNGVFSVRSAYRLGLDLKLNEHAPGISSKPAGERAMWDIIWKARVPPKVRVFGWKLVNNALGVQDLRCQRHMDIIPTCQICGMEAETIYHAMIKCSTAVALRNRLMDDWGLPDDQFFNNTGPDWAIISLSQVNEQMRAKILFLWWRTWHLRNNIIFGDGKCGIEQSAIFLQAYLQTVQDTRDI